MNFSTEELRSVAEHCNERSLYKEQELYSQVTKPFTKELKKTKSCFFWSVLLVSSNSIKLQYYLCSLWQDLGSFIYVFFLMWIWTINQNRSALWRIKSDLERTAQRFIILQAISFQVSDHRSPKLVFESTVLNHAEGKNAIIGYRLISRIMGQWVYQLCPEKNKCTLPQSHIPPRYSQPQRQMAWKAVWVHVCAALSQPYHSPSTQQTGRAPSHLLRCQ